MAATTLLVRHATAAYPCQARGAPPLLDAWLFARGGEIVDMGVEPCPVPAADVVVDGRGKVLLPGLINLHHHFFQSLTRAVPDGQRQRSLGWLRCMYPLWQELTPEAARAAAQVAAAELLLTGATTSADFAYLYPRGDGEILGAEVEAVRALGLRLHVVRGCTPSLEHELVRELAGVTGFDAIAIVEERAAILAACEAAIAKFHDGGRFAMTRVAVGPTSVPYRDPGLLRDLVAMSESAGAGRHTHLQPRPDEVALCQELHGCRPNEYLERVGWLGDRSWLAHGVLHAAPDIEVLARAGSGVAHCPNQNMRLGYPVGPVPAMRAAGVRVGIGVDGAGSNDGGAMLLELRFVLMVHRLAGVHPDYPPERWMTPEDVLWMATRDAADILGRDDIGRLAPGAAADMILVDLRQVGYAGGLHDPLGVLLVAGDSSRVDTTIVNGVVVVRDGKLLSGRETDIVDEANRIAAAMVRRAQTRTGLGFGSIAPAVTPLMGPASIAR